MTYGECDKALKKYGFFLKKNKYGNFDKNSGSVTVVCADEPKDITPDTKSEISVPNINKNKSDDDTSSNKELIANKNQLKTENGPFLGGGSMVGTVDIGEVYDFSIFGNETRVPLCVVKAIYKLSATPINKRRKDVKSLTVNSLKNFSKKLGKGSSKKVSRKSVEKALSRILNEIEEN